eukprot:COSAG02_NODE_565_length_20246_cov_13.930163_7_plen_2401_part_00
MTSLVVQGCCLNFSELMPRFHPPRRPGTTSLKYSRDGDSCESDRQSRSAAVSTGYEPEPASDGGHGSSSGSDEDSASSCCSSTDGAAGIESEPASDGGHGSSSGSDEDSASSCCSSTDGAAGYEPEPASDGGHGSSSGSDEDSASSCCSSTDGAAGYESEPASDGGRGSSSGSDEDSASSCCSSTDGAAGYESEPPRDELLKSSGRRHSLGTKTAWMDSYVDPQCADSVRPHQKKTRPSPPLPTRSKRNNRATATCAISTDSDSDSVEKQVKQPRRRAPPPPRRNGHRSERRQTSATAWLDDESFGSGSECNSSLELPPEPEPELEHIRHGMLLCITVQQCNASPNWCTPTLLSNGQNKVIEIKEIISNMVGTPTNAIRVAVDGCELHDDYALRDYVVGEASTLEVGVNQPKHVDQIRRLNGQHIDITETKEQTLSQWHRRARLSQQMLSASNATADDLSKTESVVVRYLVGSTVKIFSQSQDRWVAGEVESVDPQKSTITVVYTNAKGTQMQKMVPLDSPHLRVVSTRTAESNAGSSKPQAQPGSGHYVEKQSKHAATTKQVQVLDILKGTNIVRFTIQFVSGAREWRCSKRWSEMSSFNNQLKRASTPIGWRGNFPGKKLTVKTLSGDWDDRRLRGRKAELQIYWDEFAEWANRLASEHRMDVFADLGQVQEFLANAECQTQTGVVPVRGVDMTPDPVSFKIPGELRELDDAEGEELKENVRNLLRNEHTLPDVVARQTDLKSAPDVVRHARANQPVVMLDLVPFQQAVLNEYMLHVDKTNNPILKRAMVRYLDEQARIEQLAHSEQRRDRTVDEAVLLILQTQHDEMCKAESVHLEHLKHQAEAELTRLHLNHKIQAREHKAALVDEQHRQQAARDADRLGRADESMPTGTSICVAGFGVGKYVSWINNQIGANEHEICFSLHGRLSLKLKQERWTVFEFEMDSMPVGLPTTELARANPRWIRSAESSTCMLCKSNFGRLSSSKHHCRYCGLAVCRSCSKGTAILHRWLDAEKPHEVRWETSKVALRVCDGCRDSDVRTHGITLDGHVQVPASSEARFRAQAEAMDQRQHKQRQQLERQIAVASAERDRAMIARARVEQSMQAKAALRQSRLDECNRMLKSAAKVWQDSICARKRGRLAALARELNKIKKDSILQVMSNGSTEEVAKQLLESLQWDVHQAVQEHRRSVTTEQFKIWQENTYPRRDCSTRHVQKPQEVLETVNWNLERAKVACTSRFQHQERMRGKAEELIAGGDARMDRKEFKQAFKMFSDALTTARETTDDDLVQKLTLRVETATRHHKEQVQLHRANEAGLGIGANVSIDHQNLHDCTTSNRQEEMFQFCYMPMVVQRGSKCRHLEGHYYPAFCVVVERIEGERVVFKHTESAGYTTFASIAAAKKAVVDCESRRKQREVHILKATAALLKIGAKIWVDHSCAGERVKVTVERYHGNQVMYRYGDALFTMGPTVEAAAKIVEECESRRQHREQLRACAETALRDGVQQISGDHFDRAVETFARGLSEAKTAKDSDLVAKLQGKLDHAKEARQAAAVKAEAEKAGLAIGTVVRLIAIESDKVTPVRIERYDGTKVVYSLDIDNTGKHTKCWSRGKTVADFVKCVEKAEQREQMRARAETALRDGVQQISGDHFDRAVETFARGLSEAKTAKDSDLVAKLQGKLDHAKEARQAAAVKAEAEKAGLAIGTVVHIIKSDKVTPVRIERYDGTKVVYSLDIDNTGKPTQYWSRGKTVADFAKCVEEAQEREKLRMRAEQAREEGDEHMSCGRLTRAHASFECGLSDAKEAHIDVLVKELQGRLETAAQRQKEKEMNERATAAGLQIGAEVFIDHGGQRVKVKVTRYYDYEQVVYKHGGQEFYMGSNVAEAQQQMRECEQRHQKMLAEERSRQRKREISQKKIDSILKHETRGLEVGQATHIADDSGTRIEIKILRHEYTGNVDTWGTPEHGCRSEHCFVVYKQLFRSEVRESACKLRERQAAAVKAEAEREAREKERQAAAVKAEAERAGLAIGTVVRLIDLGKVMRVRIERYEGTKVFYSYDTDNTRKGYSCWSRGQTVADFAECVEDARLKREQLLANSTWCKCDEVAVAYGAQPSDQKLGLVIVGPDEDDEVKLQWTDESEAWVHLSKLAKATVPQSEIYWTEYRQFMGAQKAKAEALGIKAALQAGEFDYTPSKPNQRLGLGDSVLEPDFEASTVDMSTDPRYPPQEFNHEHWCAARDALWTFGRPYKSDHSNWRCRVYRAATALNIIQADYGHRMGTVGATGRLLAERAVLVVLVGSGELKIQLVQRKEGEAVQLVDHAGKKTGFVPGKGKPRTWDYNNLCNNIDFGGFFKKNKSLQKNLHKLRGDGNLADHDGLPDIRPEQKREVVHAAYKVAVQLWRFIDENK